MTWQGSKETGDRPERHSPPQLRRLCLGDVKASGGSVLLVPMITSVYRRLGKACEGGRRDRRAPDELGSYALRQRDLELYVINTAPWFNVCFYALFYAFFYTKFQD